MNYLAHAYLSFGNEGILVGNMISDFVKGKRRFDFPVNIQKGIILHRRIDAFTDMHFATRLAREVFKPIIGLYSGAFVDVVYDHFLARDEKKFAPEGLEYFTQGIYQVLDDHSFLLPEKFNSILPLMRSGNWLLNYRFTKGIERSFAGLFRRAKYLDQNDATIFELFMLNYDRFYECYQLFFPALKEFAFAEYITLMES